MNGRSARSLRTEDSLHVLVKKIRKASSEAYAYGVKPITAGGLRLSLRIASAHCNGLVEVSRMRLSAAIQQQESKTTTIKGFVLNGWVLIDYEMSRPTSLYKGSQLRGL